MKSWRKLILGTVLISSLFIAPAMLPSAQAEPNYPTQQEVENARKNVAKKKAMIKRIQGIIADLTDEQLILEKQAMLKAEKYNQAKDEEDAVAAKVEILQKKVDAATAEAKAAKTQLGRIASQMWRDGAAGTSLN